jgi:nitroimidazol reductase NimA-like FMN-containing flavoprotein (pyridoxamine 5'-phosphate oxidase superfamily)
MTSNRHRMIVLDSDTCRQLIASHPSGLGRVAFAEDGDPDWPTVLPVNYVYIDGAVYFRTFEGSKLYAALRHQRVAFEVDHVDEGWREGWSVHARGTLTVVRDPDVTRLVDTQLVSWAAGEHEQLVALVIGDLTGRRIVGQPAD